MSSRSALSPAQSTVPANVPVEEKVRALGGVHWDASTQRYAAGPRR